MDDGLPPEAVCDSVLVVPVHVDVTLCSTSLLDAHGRENMLLLKMPEGLGFNVALLQSRNSECMNVTLPLE
jgi:hypothetical protein